MHYLVALAFLGPAAHGCEVRHKDGTRDNNHVENLEYGSRTDNVADARKHGTLYSGHDTHRKIPRADHDLIRSGYITGERPRVIASRYRVSEAAIYRILRCGL